MVMSIIVPCLNEEEVLPLFYQDLESLLPDLEIEIEYVFVDDGSSDGTLELLKSYREQNPAVHYISFSRNFGKEAALYAGLQYATGDLVVVMDADLQDPPSMLLEMKALLDQNADLDCVGTRRTSRGGEPVLRSFCADLFYRLMQKISPVALPLGVRDFRMMRRSVVDAILSLTESNRFSKGLFAWVGFKTHYLDYPNVERQAGKTSWSFRQLFFYSIEGIVNFSDFPLIIAFVAGLLSCFIS
ncbi:glycosyltransferase family 2 protein, partial [Streptococcus pseudopneumoniae]|uniref:glycosyltransferase family 2 protein n=1 Tax=Streptococcus pseudopneumoniae TaxID=257758 RepID=UPI00066EBECD